MRDGVDAGAGGDVARLREGQFRVEDGDFRGGFGVAASHLFVSLGVGDQRERLALAAGAGGGRDDDERQHLTLGQADAPVVLHPATVGQQEVCALGRVHRAAAAEAEERVDASPLGQPPASLDAVGGGVLNHLVKHHHLQPGGLERLAHRGDVPGADEAGVGDEQDAFQAKLGGKLSGARRPAVAENQARALHVVERGQRIGVFRQ